MHTQTEEDCSNFKKKGDPPICRNMGEPGGLYAKWYKTDSKGKKKNLQDLLYIRNLIPLN